MMQLGFNSVKQEWAMKFADDLRLRALTNKRKFQDTTQKELGDLAEWRNRKGNKCEN